jgi:hypothetical protein
MERIQSRTISPSFIDKSQSKFQELVEWLKLIFEKFTDNSNERNDAVITTGMEQFLDSHNLTNQQRDVYINIANTICEESNNGTTNLKDIDDKVIQMLKDNGLQLSDAQVSEITNFIVSKINDAQKEKAKHAVTEVYHKSSSEYQQLWRQDYDTRSHKKYRNDDDASWRLLRDKDNRIVADIKNEIECYIPSNTMPDFFKTRHTHYQILTVYVWDKNGKYSNSFKYRISETDMQQWLHELAAQK